MNKRWPHRGSNHTVKKRVKRDTPNLGLEPIIFFREEVNDVKRFWDLVKQSVIVQGVVTLAFVGTACYLYVTGQELPESLIYFVSGVLGFFFGAKIQSKIGG